MSKVKDIIRVIEDFAPLWLQEEFDNSGLLIGDKECNISKILIALDIDLSVIDEAIQKGTEIIVAHHPVIFNPITDVTLDNINGQIITKAIKNNIAIYAAHTNVDNANDSIAKELADSLNCKNTEALDFTCGVRATLPEKISMRELISKVSLVIKDYKIKSVGNLDERVSTIVFANGASGGNEGLLLYALENADALITAEVKHHIAVLAKQSNYKIIECGHFESESLFMDLIYRKIKNGISDIEIIISESSKSPYNS